ncbi:unnamed protein product [Pylaiella littoralis]
MLFDDPPQTDLKGSVEGIVVPGFPTESVREFKDNSPAAAAPIMVRRISSDDKAKLKAFSIQNDSAGWLKKKLFMKEVTWPRELYLNVLGCKALVPHSSATSEETPTATASVTTDGDTGDRTASPPAVGGTSNGSGGSGNPRSTGGMSGSGDSSGGDPCCDNDEPPPGGALGAAAVDALAAAADSGDGGDGDEESVRMGEDADSRESSSAEREKVQDDSGNELMAGVSSSAEGGEKEEIRGECFVRVHNATTGRDLQTETVQGGTNPGFHETFVVPCQGPRDALVLEIFFGEGEKARSIGEAALPLDVRVVGVSHPVLLSVKDKQGRSRGFLRVEAFWLDEAKPRKETGEFYYKVVHPSGVSLRELPCTGADRTVHVLGYGEVFVACERQWLVGGEQGGGDCNPVFVQVMAAKDRWNRSGWCFETLYKSGASVPVLERVSPPLRESGRYFYRVINTEGARLHLKADPKSKLCEDVLPAGQVLEASHRWTPAGSPVTYVTMVTQGRGFIIQKCGEKVVNNDAGEPAFEEVECPKSTVVSSVGVAKPPPVPTASAEAEAAATASIGVAAAAADADCSNGKPRSSSSSPIVRVMFADGVVVVVAAAAAAAVAATAAVLVVAATAAVLVVAATAAVLVVAATAAVLVVAATAAVLVVAATAAVLVVAATAAAAIFVAAVVSGGCFSYIRQSLLFFLRYLGLIFIFSSRAFNTFSRPGEEEGSGRSSSGSRVRPKVVPRSRRGRRRGEEDTGHHGSRRGPDRGWHRVLREGRGGEAIRGNRGGGVRDAGDGRALGEGEHSRTSAHAGRLHEHRGVWGLHLQGFPRKRRCRQDRTGHGSASSEAETNPPGDEARQRLRADHACRRHNAPFAPSDLPQASAMPQLTVSNL